MAKSREQSPSAQPKKRSATREASSPAGSAAKRRKAPRGNTRRASRGGAFDDEAPSVLSGRLLAATVILVAMSILPFTSLGKVIEREESVPSDTGDWRVGGSAKVHVTLITADFNKLGCYSDQVFQGYRCQYENETQAFRRDPKAPLDDNKKDMIQPYRTHGTNKLIFIAGLWATPALSTRLHFETPRGVAEGKLARFVAECEVEFIGQMKNPGVRWSPSGKWIHEGDPLVAKPKSCRILDPDKS